jgi:6-phosphogluconolactonase (cycloisomerase 2 family)
MKPILLSAILFCSCMFTGCGGNSGGPHIGSPVGPFVAAVGQTSDNLFNFKGSNSGAISPISSSATGHAPSAVLITSPDTLDHAVYVTDSVSNNLTIFNMDSSSGALMPMGISVAVGSNPVAIAIAGGASSSPQPQFGFIYVLNQGSNNVSAFDVTDRAGNLMAVPGSPFPTQANPQAITVAAVGTSPTSIVVYVYVANGALGTISGFRANADGSLTELPGSPFAAGGNISWVTARLSFLYASDAGNNAVIGYQIQADGTLKPVMGSPFAAGSLPGAINAPALDNFLYVVNRGGNSVSGFAVDPVQGTLTPMAGSPFPTGTTPVYVAVESNGRVYVANHGSNSISAYTKDFNTGVLTPVPGSPFPVATSPNWIDTLFIMNVD